MAYTNSTTACTANALIASHLLCWLDNNSMDAYTDVLQNVWHSVICYEYTYTNSWNVKLKNNYKNYYTGLKFTVVGNLGNHCTRNSIVNFKTISYVNRILKLCVFCVICH